MGTLLVNVIGSADAARAAERFAEIMGVELDGRDGEAGKFIALRVNETLRLSFYDCLQSDAIDAIAPMHRFIVRFRADYPTFDGIVSRLRSQRRALRQQTLGPGQRAH